MSTTAADADESADDARENGDTVAAAELTEATEATEVTEAAAAAVDVDPKSWVADAAGRGGRLRLVAAAVLIVLLTAAGVEGWFVFQRHQRDAAASAALDAAKEFTVKLANIDPDAVDQTFTDVLDGSTGRFHELYAQSGEQLRQALIDNAAAAHGTVIEAAVKSASKDKVEVMLFVDQSVYNNKLPQAQLDRSRIVLTLDKVGGRWLVSDIEHP